MIILLALLPALLLLNGPLHGLAAAATTGLVVITLPFITRLAQRLPPDFRLPALVLFGGLVTLVGQQMLVGYGLGNASALLIVGTLVTCRYWRSPPRGELWARGGLYAAALPLMGAVRQWLGLSPFPAVVSSAVQNALSPQAIFIGAILLAVYLWSASYQRENPTSMQALGRG